MPSPSVVDKIVSVLQDAADFWTDEHPAKRFRPDRDWRHPQIAGYENHPYFKDIQEVFERAPLSETVGDFTLRRAASPGEVFAGAGSTTPGWYNTKTGEIAIIPLKRDQTKYITAHELGHNYLRNKYGLTGSETEIPASKIAYNIIKNLPEKDVDVVPIINAVAGVGDKKDIETYKRAVDEIARFERSIPFEIYTNRSVWK